MQKNEKMENKIKNFKNPLTRRVFLSIIIHALLEKAQTDLIRNYEFGVWRSTQEAEEVPLLRV